MGIHHGERNNNDNGSDKTRKLHQSLATISATLGSFGLGNVLGWTSPALHNLQMTGELGYISSNDASWIASLPILGALLSGPLIGFLMNKIGRRGTMLAISLPFSLGWFLIAGSLKCRVLIYYGRFITGLCGGAFTVIIPVYVSEIVEECFRGRLGSVMVLMLVSGILFAYICGTFLSWFWLSLVCGFVPLILFIAMKFVPESPKYLLMKRLDFKAEQAFRWLRNLGEDCGIGKEFVNVRSSIDIAEKQSFKWSRVTAPRITKPASICLSLMFFQQMGGINSVTMYAVDIFKSASDELDPNFASIGIGVVQVVFVSLSLMLVDKIGRKVLLMGSSLLMSSSMFFLGFYFYFKEQNNLISPEGFTWVPIATLITFIIAYSFGMGPIPWLLVSEVLNPEFKSEISALITFTYWALAFVATKTFQDLISLFQQSGCYWISSMVCFWAGIFTCFAVPETKGKSSIEIRKYFGDLCTDETLEESQQLADVISISGATVSVQYDKDRTE